MGTANSHSLLPHPEGAFLGLLNRKQIHRSPVQHPIYKMLYLDPLVVPDELQWFGTVGPVNSGFGGAGRVLGYVLGGSWGGWRWHGRAYQGLLQGFHGDLVWG